MHRLVNTVILCAAILMSSAAWARVLSTQQGSKPISGSASQDKFVALPGNGTAQLNGLFEIFNAQTGKVLEVAGASTSDGALVQQNALNGNAEQQWQFVAIGDGSYAIMNSHSGFVMDVIGASATDGTLVQQYQSVGGANQHWVLTLVDDVHYSIVNVNSGKALDIPLGSAANNTPVQQWDYLGDEQQLWVLVPITSYNIVNDVSSNVLDVVGASTSNGAQIVQATPDGARDQQWQLVPVGGGYYAIVNRNSGKVLDDTGGSISDGNVMQQYDFVGDPNQQWQLLALNATDYEIVNRASGKVLDDTGASTSSGTLIQQWDYVGGTNQTWQVNPVTYYNIVNRESGLVLDVPGASTVNGQTIQQWALDGAQQQQWQIVPASTGYYAITNNATGKVLDDTGGSTSSGTLVQQYQYVGDTNQQWQFTSVTGGYFAIQNVTSGDVLDVIGGSTLDGALIQQYTYLAGANQQWELVPVGVAGTSTGAQPTVILDTPVTGATQLSGHVYNADPSTNKIVIYALTNEWYVQPLADAPFTNISADGSWTSSTNPWNTLVVLLVNPAIYTPSATEITNPALDPGVLAYTIYPLQPVSLSFSGYTWGIKTTGNSPGDQFDPGPNFWSNDASVVNVAADGLHLKINQINGVWQCGEVYLNQSLGYGTYTVQVSSRLDQLDQNTVAAPLFIYAAPGQELDNEYSGLGGLVPNPYNAQFVVQPYTVSGNIVYYTQPSTAQFTTQIQWAADHVTFISWNGWTSTPGPTDIIYQWTYNGSYIPPPGQERVHMNLWLLNGNAPVSGVGDEMVINSFTFQPGPS